MLRTGKMLNGLLFICFARAGFASLLHPLQLMKIHLLFCAVLAAAGTQLLAQTTGLYVTSSNNVGIGTTIPVQKLHLYGAAGAPAGSGTAQNGLMRFQQSTDNGILDMGVMVSGSGAWLQSTDLTALSVYYPLLLNPNGGNVGIGAIAPLSLLDLANTVQASDRLRLSGQEYFQAGNTSTDGVVFRLGVNRIGNRQLWISDSAAAINATEAQLQISLGAGRGFSVINSISTDGTTRLPLILNNGTGNVGIGTNVPAARLDVAGNTNVQGNLTVAGTCSASNFSSTGTTSFQSINTTGNVGIGTTTPADALDVVGTTTALSGPAGQVGTSYLSMAPGSTPSLSFAKSVNAWSDTWWNFTMQPNNSLLLDFSSVPQVVFQNGQADFYGNVGIGTTSPQAALDVNGDINQSVGTSADTIHGANKQATRAVGQVTLGSDSAGSSAFVGMKTQVFAGQGSEAANQADIEFFTWGNSYAGSREVMRIRSSGNVGIGTTTPASKLDVQGTPQGPGYEIGVGRIGAGGTNLIFGIDASATPYSWVQSVTNGVASRNLILEPNAGNVGIGTTSPAYLLDVAGQVHATSFVSSTQTYADFVFKPGYQLPPLSKVEASIKKDGHLPDIPSEEEARAHGIDLAQMQVKLLQKIEELTLHQIEQEKRLDAQAQQIEQLENENTSLRAAR
jgi:hypothetical protein